MELQVTRHKIEVTRQDILEATRFDLELTRRDFEHQLAAVEARTRCTGTGNVAANAGKLNPSTFDGFKSWVVSSASSRLRLTIVIGQPAKKPHIC
jgi:hypothetical protein